MLSFNSTQKTTAGGSLSLKKLIFLDIDGVLNSVQFILMQNRLGKLDIDKLCSICISNLSYIMEECLDVQIVISSTWRYRRTIEQLREVLSNSGFKYSDRVIGKTGTRSLTGIRGEEIQDWLDKHSNTKQFVIIDDDRDMAHLMKHLFKTNNKHGLSLEIAQQIIKYFNPDVGILPGHM